jgi:hypothetical protein
VAYRGHGRGRRGSCCGTSGLGQAGAEDERERRHRDEDHLTVRLVPISADQMRVLESLQRAFFGLAADVNRDLGVQDDDSIAGGLYRIWSTLDMIAALWKEEAEDAAAPERWRQALAAIANDVPIEEARLIARMALAAAEPYE